MSAMTDHIPVVETDRLRLRAAKLDDLPAVTAFYQTERSHLVGGPLDARAVNRVVLASIGSWALRGFGFWQIADKVTDAWLGATGLIFGPDWAEPELGWSVSEDAEGKGIAFEAALAARQYCARHLGHDGVISYIAPSNTRSAALAARMGAVIEAEGTLLGHDVHIYRHPSEASQ